MVNTTKLVDSRVFKATWSTWLFPHNLVKLSQLFVKYGHIQKCPLWPVPHHFRNTSAASDYVYIIPILIKRVQTLSLRRRAKGTVYDACTGIMPGSPNKEWLSRISKSMPHSLEIFCVYFACFSCQRKDSFIEIFFIIIGTVYLF